MRAIMSDTWLEPERDGNRKARVRFPDGNLKVVTLAGTADTFFSIPVRGHDGYVTHQETKWSAVGENEFVFRPHTKSAKKYGEWPAEIEDRGFPPEEEPAAHGRS